MAKRKKHMKLPNGYGSIKYLGSGRRNPYAVYPPATEVTETGFRTPKAIGYVRTWDEGYKMLTLYHLQKKGEIELVSSKKTIEIDISNPDQRIDKSIYIKEGNKIVVDTSPTFEDVFKEWFEFKYVGSKYAIGTIRNRKSSFAKLSGIAGKKIDALTLSDLQEQVDREDVTAANSRDMLVVMHGVFEYAMKHDYIQKDYSQYVKLRKDMKWKNGNIFTDEELRLIWQHKNEDIAKLLLVLIYSGMRISEFNRSLEYHIEDRYVVGGVKTKAGKNRVIPIHTAVLPLILDLKSKRSDLLDKPYETLRRKLREFLEAHGIEKASDGQSHTFHDARHTFSYLCDRFGVQENNKKFIMGHTFQDVTNSVYGHRKPEDLVAEVDKIQIITQ